MMERSRLLLRNGGGLALLALAGCADPRAGAGPVTTPVSGSSTGLVTAVVPGDPVAAFAAGAQPGAVAQLVLSGAPVRVRLLRAYFAASGRECREVLLGTGIEERSSLVCQDPAAGWVPARPLLRTAGATGRPIAGP